MKPKADLVRRARWLALLVGLMDAGTGLGLLFAPGLVLKLMQVPAPVAGAWIFVRWVGVFVAAVGTSYLWALWRGGVTRLVVILECTLLFRTAVAIFVLAAWHLDVLSAAWLSVAATDLAVAALQAVLIEQLGREVGHE